MKRVFLLCVYSVHRISGSDLNARRRRLHLNVHQPNVRIIHYSDVLFVRVCVGGFLIRFTVIETSTLPMMKWPRPFITYVLLFQPYRRRETAAICPILLFDHKHSQHMAAILFTHLSGKRWMRPMACVSVRIWRSTRTQKHLILIWPSTWDRFSAATKIHCRILSESRKYHHSETNGNGVMQMFEWRRIP